jgi:TonB family protein
VHQRLRDAAVQCSPAAARRFGGRGEVLLSFCLAATGAVDRVEVLRTSGLTVLDEAATGCVVPRGAPYPAAAAGRCFQVPVRF